ncbi:MAG TPA: hypothetical protein VH834_11105 [Solirubrobacteraceae bacterium]|jgi:hypothetical protein
MTRMPRTARGRRAGALTEERVPAPTRSLPGSHQAYRTASGCSVICGLEPARQAPAFIWLPPDELQIWHLSIAHAHRYPTWDEIADVRYELVPDDVTMALLLPPPGEYVNAHEHCFHLWQIDDRRAP